MPRDLDLFYLCLQELTRFSSQQVNKLNELHDVAARKGLQLWYWCVIYSVYNPYCDDAAVANAEECSLVGIVVPFILLPTIIGCRASG